MRIMLSPRAIDTADRKHKSCIMPAVFSMLLCVMAARSAEPPADLAIIDAAVYTMDAARSWADAVGVRDGKIAYVGSADGIRGLIGDHTRVLDLDGRFVLPGFMDSHVHPISAGLELAACDLNGAKTAGEVLDRVRAYAVSHTEEEWVAGGGWDLPLFPDANPHKKLLDAILPDRPACLASADGHSVWVNSKALELAGVTKDTVDPADGRIERDTATGEPTGTLRESASDLVDKLLPQPDAAEQLAGLERAIERAHRFGLTGLFDASVDHDELESYRELDQAGRLNTWIGIAYYMDSEKPLAGQVEHLVALRKQDWGPHVRLASAKIFADGVIEAGTAALLEPYVKRGGSKGELTWSEDELQAAAIALDKAGIQLHVHAIGDRGIRATLDAIGAAIRANGPRDRRPTMAHIQLLSPSDIPRFRALGVTASFQALWAYADSYIKDLTVPNLGPDRSRWLYPIRSMSKTGAVLAGGSDWSVSSLNPLDAIEVAVTRHGPSAAAGESWIPDERVDLPTILAAYTMGSAYAAFRDRDCGSIEVGKSADIIVLDRNLFAIAPEEISDALVLLTLFQGREVWRDPSFDVGVQNEATRR